MATPNKKTLGALGLALALVSIPVYEGIRLTDYRDPVGIPTACMGHTATAQIGRQRTLLECYELMYQDVHEHYLHVKRLVKVPLQPHQLSALVHFSYNVGQGALARSTLLKRVNAGDFAGAEKEFGKWVYGTVNGKKVVLPGLVTRRQHEAAMFRGDIEFLEEAFAAMPDGAQSLEDLEVEAQTPTQAPTPPSPQTPSNPHELVSESATFESPTFWQRLRAFFSAGWETRHGALA